MKSLKKTLGISTELVKLNVKEILQNYRNPKFWRKEWVIFKNRQFDVVWHITSINVELNNIASVVKIKNFHGRKDVFIWRLPYVACDSIPIDNPDYTQEVFEKNLLGKVLLVIDYLEREIARTTYEYRQAVNLEVEEEAKLREIAEQFLDQEGVSNKDIREAYIDWYVDNTSKYLYVNDVLESSIRKYYPTARLLACSWFGNEKEFKKEAEIVAKNKGVKKKIIYTIWKARKELDGEEYLKEAEEQLESL